VDSARHQDNQLELARQLLPLNSWREVARDGLLCIAGIQGIAAGAVLWRPDDGGPLQLLSHFGLGLVRLRSRYRLSQEAQKYLLDNGPLTLETARRRAAARGLIRSLRPLEGQLGEAWLIPLHGEGRLRGVLCTGPSLVTQELAAPEALQDLVDLAELLRLRLLGCGPETPGEQATEETPGERRSPRSFAGGRSTSARLRYLRRTYPATELMQGDSPALLTILEEIVSLADTDYTVLVEGETGTGKELAAQLLHQLSRRAQGPFEAVDCSSIPRELIESELFGHVKGAFTGASRDFRGAFERADGGTLLLDEIGDMDLRSQTRLLRVLQEGQVRRLGGDRPVPVDVRVVAATNRDLAELVRQSRFREDLYYRIHVCPLRIPALHERGDDRLVLFDGFMAQHASELARPLRRLTPVARRRLRAERFPGNVRQLQNVVRQLLVSREAKGAVDREELERVLQRASSAVREATRSAGGERRDAGPVETGHSLDEPGAKSPSGPRASGSPEPGRFVQELVDDVGTWVLARLREHRFNLSAAARTLQERRRGGAARTEVPVFDRGSLDAYLCGEYFRALRQHEFDVDAALEELAAKPHFVPRLRRKAEAYSRPLKGLSRWQGAAGRLRLREAYRRIPEVYWSDIEACAKALRRRRWKRP
jgi:DNA-binding NtrC family response regulator